MRNAAGNRTGVAKARALLLELGRRSMVDGHEDMISGVAPDLVKERKQSVA